ncbi:MAG: VacB/RNase II family 3'-5' exoribonuclease [Clostridia bacterium]|nr:VacB/RNase II family 3'-5' exoribonuclease [Clostridia bacterium]
MKRKDTKAALGRFARVAKHKRRGKDKSRDALLNEIAATGVAFEGVRIGSKEDGGRRGRTSAKSRRDEVRAEGVYSGSRGGFGFVTLPDSPHGDIFIPEGRSGGALDGDRVEIIYHAYRAYTGEERTEGRVTAIVAEGREVFVGVLEEERVRLRRHGKPRLVFIADDPKITAVPIVRDAAGASAGEKVAVKIKRSTSYLPPECDVVAVLGAPDSRAANYEAILLESGIPIEFSPEELAEAERSSRREINYADRRDLREEIIFTIDGRGAKDLDDAISLLRTDEGWRLGVHIADVSYFVDEKTALDRAVMARGTSVYFVDKVVPMLPPSLSNGACSLGAGEDKCTLSAIISLDNEGAIVGLEIIPAVIRSAVRGVYSEVNAIFDGEASAELVEKYSAVLPSLRLMRELYELLLERARKRGMLELELPESVIEVDASGEPIAVYPSERGLSERIIEQFMLTANEAVAARLRREGIPAVYRVHELPPEEKLRDLLTYASNLGVDIRGIDPERPSPSELSRLLASAQEKGLFEPLSYLTLRSMAKACYSPSPDGHFGLGLADYCHFTSPIRRLSDLATHRIIRRVLLEGRSPRQYSSYARRAAAAATDSELRAVAAERRIEDLYKTIYMSAHVGEIFDARVSSVTSFGVFVMPANTCEGLVHIDSMPGYFTFDERNMCVRSGSLSYRVGDSVRVRLEEADIARCKLSFSIIL